MTSLTMSQQSGIRYTRRERRPRYHLRQPLNSRHEGYPSHRRTESCYEKDKEDKSKDTDCWVDRTEGEAKGTTRERGHVTQWLYGSGNYSPLIPSAKEHLWKEESEGCIWTTWSRRGQSGTSFHKEERSTHLIRRGRGRDKQVHRERQRRKRKREKRGERVTGKTCQTNETVLKVDICLGQDMFGILFRSVLWQMYMP